MKINKATRGLLVFVLSMMLVNHVNADKIPFTSSIKTTGDTIKIGLSNSMDTVYTELGQDIQRIWSVADRIILGIDKENRNYNLQDTTVKVTLHVVKKDSNNIASSFDVILEVNAMAKGLNEDYVNKQMYLFNDGYSFSIAITQIEVDGQQVQALPDYLYINSEIVVGRTLEFTGSAPVVNNIQTINSCDEGNETIEFSWVPLTGAEEYQLEWTFVNDYGLVSEQYLSPSALTYNFRDNSTRITTTNHHYQITNIFEHGYVIYRVRGVGRDMAHPDKYIYGAWSLDDNNSVQNAINISQHSLYNNLNPHEWKKNWQYASTYAEQGKKKEVISYFDGSLRNRQSVTKTNTDNTVLVGQTIYDNQGRPAINVLPVPVSGALQCDQTTSGTNTIKYYSKFNTNEDGNTYSSVDFDNGESACALYAHPMSNNTGAANYYSPLNPDFANQQAYLPNAQQYPFTQIQYTPDNTGRVSRQSGVGADFALGSGKEIKNFYGQPNQIQLDRMFGSEAGDATHYKKNLVFDANGQASVSYLNQEGKVVATSLTGGATEGMASLPGGIADATPLTIDLFNKDGNGYSESNKVNADGNSIVFSTEILVASQGTPYTFNYDLNVSDYSDECMPENVCYSCIYDLQIQVLDECGSIVPNVGDDLTYANRKMVGRFTTGDGITFNTECLGTNFEYQLNGQAFILGKGVYTVEKILTINQDALDYYVEQYTDTTKNTCLKKLSEFQAEAIGSINFADCHITCETCVTALGTKEDWIDNGGTSLQWDRMVEECKEPCKQLSICESTYQMLLDDVSPYGQYAQFQLEQADGTMLTSVGDFPYSVLNINNSFGGGTSNWKNPKVTINGSVYNSYLDEYGEVSKIKLTKNYSETNPQNATVMHEADGTPYTYTPLPMQSATIMYEADGTPYIYPEQLKKVDDFVSYWEPSWAKSLVQYHPEYCYYEQCSKYSIEYPAYNNLSSTAFDQLLMRTETFQDAIQAGLIGTDNKVVAFYTTSTTHAYDPYFVSGSLYGVPEDIQALQYKWDHYTLDPAPKNMMQAASVAVRYGTNYGATPNITEFGTGSDESVKNSEWVMFKNMYLSEKQKIQQNRARSACSGVYNDSWFTDHNKQQRFYNNNNLPSSVPQSQAEVDQQIINQTNQCPITFDFMNFLSGMASSDKLAETAVPLVNHPEFTQRLYQSVIGSGSFIGLNWNMTSTASTITAIVTDPSDPDGLSANGHHKRIFLDKLNTDYNWNDIDGIQDLEYTTHVGTHYNFTAHARLYDAQNTLNPYDYKPITGYTEINLADCGVQEAQRPNNLAEDISNLWNALASNDVFNLTTPVSLSVAPYSYYMTNIYTKLFLTDATGLVWEKATNNTDYYIYKQGVTSKKMVFRVNHYTPDSYDLDNITHFGTLSLNNQEGFVIDGLKSDNSLETNLNGFVFILDENNEAHSVSLGEIGIITPAECTGTQFELRDQLEDLLQGLTVNTSDFQNLIGSKDLDQSYDYTPLIASVFAPENCMLTLNTHLSGTFQSISITGNLIPCGSLTTDGAYSNFYMLADYTIDNNGTPVIIHDTIFGGSPCMRINRCLCPTINKENITRWDKADQFSHCMEYADQISVGTNPVNNLMINSLFECMDDLNIDSTGAWKCLGLEADACESCLKKLYLSKSQNWVESNLDDHGFENVQDALNHIENGEVDFAYDSPSIGYDNSSLLLFNTEGQYLYYQKRFTVETQMADIDLNITPFRSVFIFINNVFVDSLVAPCAETQHFHLAGYSHLLHQGENVLNILYRRDVCDNDKFIMAISGSIRSFVPCETPDTTIVLPIVDPTITNPCESYLVANALTNAQIAYDQQMNRLITDISANYTAHCMGAVENFTYAYPDKEYHFTLYYYDQAGNLIKTIPPEGVELLNITGPTSPDEIRAKTDRTNNTHDLFTNHRMETRYEYNSLNQLVKQVTPDHDPMDIWEFKQPNGLPQALKITSSQFVNANQGYLTGSVLQNGHIRGVMYQTNNGGAFWTKVNDLIASNLEKVQMIGAVGYAVGSQGVMLKTIDNGGTWDLLPLYENNITVNLRDLYFADADHGIVVGENGKAYKTSDGGVTFTLPLTGIPATDVITAVANKGTEFIATVTTGSGDEQIYINLFGSSSWTLKDNNVRVDNLTKVHYANGKWYAVGANGILLSSANGSNWAMMKSETLGEFNDIWFKNANTGVALIDHKLMKTLNGGVTWTMLGDADEIYTAIYPESGMAVGEHGLVKQLSIGTSWVGISDMLKPRAGFDNNTVGVYASGTSKYCIATHDVVGTVSNDSIFIAIQGGILDHQYHWYKTAVTNQLGFTGYKSIYFNYTTNEGLFLTNEGNVLKVALAVSLDNIGTYTITPNYASGIKDMQQIGNNIIAIGNAGTFSVPIDQLGNAFTSLSPNAPADIISVDGNEDNLVCVRNNGDIYTTAMSTISWENKSTFIKPLLLNDIYATANAIYAVGENGKMLVSRSTDLNTIQWNVVPTGTFNTLNAVKYHASTTSDPSTIWLAGNNGHISTLNENGTEITLGTTMQTNTEADLYDFAVNTAGNKGYAVGTNGTEIYLNFDNGVWNITGSGSLDFNFKGVDLNENDNAIVVGQHSAIYHYSGVSGMKNRKLFTPTLNQLSFVNTQNGYVVGESGIIRHTTDGCNTWNIVVPVVSPLKVANTVCAISAYNAIIGGNSGYVGRITGNGTPLTITVSGLTTDVNVIKSRGTTVYMGGSSGKLYKSINSGVGWSEINTGTTTADIRAIHIFSNNGCVVAGSQGLVGTYNNSAFITDDKNLDIAPGTQLNDVFFHDDRNGYVVGNGGAIYKCYLTNNSFDLGIGIHWKVKTLKDDYLANLNDTLNINLTTISFPSRYNGFIGGNISGTATYARLLHDESMLYSTYFWYDRLGRMVVSRNTKQFNKQAFSYTLYDHLGRIKEVGEITEPENTSKKFFTIFGTDINNLYNANVIDDDKFYSWIIANTRTQVTRTFYDYPLGNPLLVQENIVQENLRKRVATATYSDIYHADSTQYDYATHYSYDIHGNVKTLWQDNPALETVSGLEAQRFKRIDYDYDLVSGKVNEVNYQANQPDQFIHRYDYDDDNRIIHVQTSKDGVTFDNDALYTYYKHGPLARVEIGEEKVQGIDYAYTLQGWIKGVNSNSLNPDVDMGGDGKIGGANVNIIGRDVFGYSLNYFDGDYAAIDPDKWDNVTDRFEAGKESSDWMSTHHNLYNGNISSMATTITNPATRAVMPLGTTYQYDQLNRLVEMNANNRLDIATNQWVVQGMYIYTNIYKNNYTYDANGNISSLRRRNRQGFDFDRLSYNYQKSGGKTVSNRLYHVNDLVDAGFMPDDIDDQGTFIDDATVMNTRNNYGYDEIGNLQRDSAEGIQHIEWTAYGKIKSITRRSDYTKTVDGQTVYPSNLEFRYDATGNRIAKIEKPRDAGGEKSSAYWITTYYVRDATGNPMATYKEAPPSAEVASYKLMERPIYGSSRLGIDNTQLELIGYTAPTGGITTYELGLKQYELTNHLGNVLSTVSDKKIPHTTNGTDIDYYLADITSATDYYPFGSPMDGRTFSSDKYRFGFNGQEKDDEVAGAGNTNTAMFWEYDTRLGRRWNVDPKPIPSISYYACFANNPIQNYDILGDSLDAANNSESKNDIRTIVKPENNKYIVFEAKDNATVKVNLTKEFRDMPIDQQQKLLKNDVGLGLLKDIIDAPEKMLFEATEVFLGKDEEGYNFAQPLSTFKFGIVNASNGGSDSQGGHTNRPRDGYDGQVCISINAIYSSDGIENRAATVFHELGENFYRTTSLGGKLDYQSSGFGRSFKYGAHDSAKNRSNGFGFHSGSSEYHQTLSTDPVILFMIMNLYLNGK